MASWLFIKLVSFDFRSAGRLPCRRSLPVSPPQRQAPPAAPSQALRAEGRPSRQPAAAAAVAGRSVLSAGSTLEKASTIKKIPL